VVDATLSWQALRNTTLGLQLNNLFDRRYAQSQYNDGQQWILGEPRSFFVTADYTFKSSNIPVVRDLSPIGGEAVAIR
jgi:iron complex outermembrane receptor protein